MNSVVMSYSWPDRCCMRTALDWTPGRPAILAQPLEMTEQQAIKHFLREYGNLGEAYLDVLKRAGWSEVSWRSLEFRDGDISIWTGSGEAFVITVSGRWYSPRERIQILAFRIAGTWQVWSDIGLEPISFMTTGTLWRHLRWLQ